MKNSKPEAISIELENELNEKIAKWTAFREKHKDILLATE
jgi:hypothetical protein